MGDSQNMGVALNCLGVNYMLLACPPSDQGVLRSYEPSPANEELVRTALAYHQQHCDIADNGGQFVANVNIGLCHGMLCGAGGGGAAGSSIAVAARHYQVGIVFKTLLISLFRSFH